MFVMVTPHVINNVEEADILSSRFNDRVTVIREKILKLKKTRKTEKTPEKEATENGNSEDKVTENKDGKPVNTEAKEAAPPKVDVPQPYIP